MSISGSIVRFIRIFHGWLLLKTDASYQPLRGMPFSRWADLPVIVRGATGLRAATGKAGGNGEELQAAAEAKGGRCPVKLPPVSKLLTRRQGFTSG
jgi:hypothetical protein